MLKDNHLLNMGLIFMVVSIAYGEDNQNMVDRHKQNEKSNFNLNLKFFGGPCTGEVQ